MIGVESRTGGLANAETLLAPMVYRGGAQCEPGEDLLRTESSQADRAIRVSTMKVLILDADERKALAAIRSLGKRGVEICAGGSSRWTQGFYSRYVSSTLIYPNPVNRFDEHVAFMLDFLERNRFDCVLPESDYTTIALARHADEFGKRTKMAVPDHELLSRTIDKLEILKTAAALGIGVPDTRCPSSPEELKAVAGEIRYPVAVKFRKGTGSIGVKYARSAEELLSIYTGPPRRPDVVFEGLPPLVQEYIPGKVHDVCVLFNHGQARAALTSMRSRTWPASGGRSVEGVTTDEPELKEIGLRLCRGIKWHGPADVEFKMDERDGKPKLLEINTRFWGGIDLSIQAGIDFPYLAAKMAIDGDVAPVFDYKVGVRYRWPFPHEFEMIWESGNRMRAIKEFLRWRRGDKYDIRLSDPFPHVAGTASAAYLTLRRMAARRRN
jgi:predicted ATP-grasp superfamily ATP-dependent carboligase